jgi:hypothetical protein
VEAIERERRCKVETEARIFAGQSLHDDRREGDTEQVTSTGGDILPYDARCDRIDDAIGQTGFPKS